MSILEKCPYCTEIGDAADIACHLIDGHAIDYDEACVWLRKKIEKAA